MFHYYFSNEVARLKKKQARAGETITAAEEEAIVRIGELELLELPWAIVHMWILERRWNGRVPVLPENLMHWLNGRFTSEEIDTPLGAFPWASVGMFLRECWAARFVSPLALIERRHTYCRRPTRYAPLSSLTFDHGPIEALVAWKGEIAVEMTEKMPKPPVTDRFPPGPPPVPPPPPPPA